MEMTEGIISEECDVVKCGVVKCGVVRGVT